MTDSRVSAYEWYLSELSVLRQIADLHDFSTEGDAAYWRQYRRVKTAYREAAAIHN